MFEGVDFNLCETLSQVPNRAVWTDVRLCNLDGTNVAFYDWGGNSSEFARDVTIYANVGTPLGPDPYWYHNGVATGRDFRVPVETLDGAVTEGIYWTYDAQMFSALAYPDPATGATFADVEAWWQAFVTG